MNMQNLWQFCSTRESPLIIPRFFALILRYSVNIRFVKYFSMSFRVIETKKISRSKLFRISKRDDFLFFETKYFQRYFNKE